MDNWKERIMELINACPGGAIGAGLGLLAAVLLLTLGLWKTVILVGCIAGGSLAGKMLMEK
ncbi:MAG: DUF2273 domain-containing protein [bacterium]|nr:DUF2273 domain-containing protein [bacterium]